LATKNENKTDRAVACATTRFGTEIITALPFEEIGLIAPLREIVEKTILACGYTTVSEFLKEPWWVISSVE
jgi:hypothetical protein